MATMTSIGLEPLGGGGSEVGEVAVPQGLGLAGAGGVDDGVLAGEAVRPGVPRAGPLAAGRRRAGREGRVLQVRGALQIGGHRRGLRRVSVAVIGGGPHRRPLRSTIVMRGRSVLPNRGFSRRPGLQVTAPGFRGWNPCHPAVEQKVLELPQKKGDLADAILNADNQGMIAGLTRDGLEFLLSDRPGPVDRRASEGSAGLRTPIGPRLRTWV